MVVLDLLQRALERLPIRGKPRLAEKVLRHSGTRELQCHPLKGLDIHLQRSQRIERLMWAGAYEREVVAFLKKQIQPNMTVLDVGANIGYISAIAAHLVGPDGLVHAFEPDPKCYARLELNLRPFPRAHAHQLAISNGCETLPLHLSSNPEEDGWGTLLTDPSTDRQTIEVQVITLDDFCSRFGVSQTHLLKIDIEGNELRALQGARRIIERDHPTIVTEINPVCLGWGGAKPADVIEFLKSFGYSIQRLDSSNIYATR
jgi:FkbM family methyltransferase